MQVPRSIASASIRATGGARHGVRSRPATVAVPRALIALGAAACAAAACTGRVRPPERPRVPLPTAAVTPAPAFEADIQHGQRIFVAHCQGCHGPQGAGDGPLASGLSPRPPDWTQPGALGERAPAHLFTSIRRGVLGSSMKRFDTVLDEPSTWDVVFFIFLRPADVRVRAAAVKAYERGCAPCHGASGVPVRSDVPTLVRSDWVVSSREALTARVAAAHPAGSPYAAGDEARRSAERIWDFLIRPPSNGYDSSDEPTSWATPGP